MLVTRAHINRDMFTLTFDCAKVPKVDTLVCLGIVIDKHFTLAKHLDRLK